MRLSATMRVELMRARHHQGARVVRLSHTITAEPMRARHQERESGLSQERESCLSHDERVAACPVRTRRKPRRTQLAPGISRSGGSGDVFITRCVVFGVLHAYRAPPTSREVNASTVAADD